MALDTSGLKSNIKALLNEMKDWDDKADPEGHFADKLSQHIETFVKSGTVSTTVASGIATAGTSPAGATTGQTVATGSGTGSIS